MLERREVAKIDISGMHVAYENWAQQAESALALRVNLPKVGKVDRLFFAGMGGSAMPGEIVSDWLGLTSEIPITVRKDHHLPKFVRRGSLILAISHSGDTEETLSIVAEAIRTKVDLAAISSGGLLEKVCERKGVPHTKVGKVLVPRVSLPYLLYPCIKILRESGAIDVPWSEVSNSVRIIEQLSKKLSVDTPLAENPAKKLAARIYQGTPVIHSSPLNRSAALRFSASLNENAKMHSIFNNLPELVHNELEGWANGADTKEIPVLLRYKDEPPEIRSRFEALSEALSALGLEIQEIWGTGSDSLSVIMSTIYALDYTSLYTAILRRVDPTPTTGIDSFKKRLKTKLDYLIQFTDILSG